MSNEHVVGVLYVARPAALPFDAESLRLLTALGAQLATYLTMVRMREAQARASRELERTHEFQQLLIGIVSHDLRNPLGVILGSAALLRKQVEDERQAGLQRGSS